MELLDIIRRTTQPEPWSEGEHIPWNEPGFSRRMLAEHLSQAHDAASRRTEIIAAQVSWIHTHLLAGQPARILDLGCGPGLYAARLGRLGHTLTGIDFSPASIEYARGLSAPGCSFRLDDIRSADFGGGYDLVMLIYGEFNIFPPETARAIVRRAYLALAEGGRLLLEPHTFRWLQEAGEEPRSWQSAPAGLFSDRPHLVLRDPCWDANRKTLTRRYYVVDAATAAVTRYAESLQAYTDGEYERLLAEAGFAETQFFPSLGSDASNLQGALMAIVARKTPKS